MSDPALADLLALAERAFPVALAGGELGTDPARPLWIDEQGVLIVALRSITTHEGMILDVREQQVALGRWTQHAPARWLAYLEATLLAAPTIVDLLGGLDAILPWDLFAYAGLLDDPELQQTDAFAAKLTDREWLARQNQAQDDQAWREDLATCGLAERLDEVRALLRPSLRLRLLELEPEPDDDDPLEPARSRFGGEPDLPPDLAWPSVGGEPLVFVAQLDLAELAGFEEAAELPREGLLAFFYAPLTPAGWSGGMQYPVEVLHLRELAALVRRPTPSGGEALRAYAIEFEGERLLPALESAYALERLRPSAEVRRFYESLARGHAEAAPIDPQALATLIVARSECDFERPIHRLLGHPASIQGDPYLDVEMSERSWAGWQEASDEAFAARERALGWRLLLQVDAYQDDELILNQDGGFFYFWIPADALAAHDWTRVRGCLQCH